MTGQDFATVIKQCEDHLFSQMRLTTRQRALYYHLLRHTHAEDKSTALIALRPLSQALAVAESSAREDIRSLNEKGCIRIEQRSRKGHVVRVLLPSQIEGIIPAATPTPTVELEKLDFYTGRRFLSALLDREGNRCFYCLKSIRADSCELDHAVSRVNGTDHSYRNIVACCHDCNTLKQATSPADFLRTLFRKSRLSAAELEERLATLEQLQSGKLVPSASIVGAAI